MKLAIGNDHSAVEMKKEIKKYLEDKGIEVIDVGTNSTESFNLPHQRLQGGQDGRLRRSGRRCADLAATGGGHHAWPPTSQGVRACVCSEPYSARLSKQHNNSNIIAFGARVIGVEMAKMIVDEWVNAKYEGGRHQVRVDMLAEIEQTQGLKAVDEQGLCSFQAGNALQSAVWFPFLTERARPIRGGSLLFYRENEIYTHSPLNT